MLSGEIISLFKGFAPVFFQQHIQIPIKAENTFWHSTLYYFLNVNWGHNRFIGRVWYPIWHHLNVMGQRYFYINENSSLKQTGQGVGMGWAFIPIELVGMLNTVLSSLADVMCPLKCDFECWTGLRLVNGVLIKA